MKNFMNHLYHGLTHGLPIMPFMTLNFLNDSTMPYIGM